MFTKQTCNNYRKTANMKEKIDYISSSIKE